MKIAILDYKNEFPNLDNFIEYYLSDYDIFWEKYSDESIEEVAADYYDDTQESLPIYSSDPDRVNRVINEVHNVLPYFITLDKSEFKSSYERMRDTNKDLFVPKILISSNKHLDLLEVSNLFNKSDIKKLKYNNGSNDPQIIDFKGLETYEFLDSLNSGHLVPATKYDDSEPLESSSNGIADNKKYILQTYELGSTEETREFTCISYSVKSNDVYGILWTDVQYEDLSEFTSKIYNIIPDDLNCNFYMEIEMHLNNFYINKIVQGFHPHIKFNQNG